MATLWRYVVAQVVDVLAYERDEDIVLLEHRLFHCAGRVAIGDGLIEDTGFTEADV